MQSLYWRKQKTSQTMLKWAWRQKWTVLLMVAGLYQFGGGLYIYAKAQFAQFLIGHAWQASLQDNLPHRPWPWADTYPVAELGIEGHSWYVLAGANGRNLAFAPTHLTASALPAEPGNSIIVGHRDTQFSALRSLQVGDVITATNLWHQQTYQISSIRIADQAQLKFMQFTEDETEHYQETPFSELLPSLTLVTCYPFDSLLPNPSLRYVIRAVASQTSALND
jgi:sortase A